MPPNANPDLPMDYFGNIINYFNDFQILSLYIFFNYYFNLS
jgi:hypothetical protein